VPDLAPLPALAAVLGTGTLVGLGASLLAAHLALGRERP